MLDPGEDPGKDFFDGIESELNVKIPPHLKRLLTLHGYANNVSLGNLTETDIVEIERFTRSDLSFIVKREEMPDYVGIFADNVGGFLIFGGEKKLLLSIKEHVLERTQNIWENTDKDPELAIDHLDDERKHLNKLVQKNIDESILILNEDEQRICRERLGTINCVISVDDRGHLISKIDCGLCKLKLKVSKYKKDGETKNARWLMGNFKSHFKKHITDMHAVRTKDENTPRNTITNYMEAPTYAMISVSHPVSNQAFGRTAASISESTSALNLPSTSSLSTNPVDDIKKDIYTWEATIKEENIPPKRGKLSTNESSSGVANQETIQDFHKGMVDDPSDIVASPKAVNHMNDGNRSSSTSSERSNKWKQEKYSRRSREIRKREKNIHNQPVIVNYLQQVDEIATIIQENED